MDNDLDSAYGVAYGVIGGLVFWILVYLCI